MIGKLAKVAGIFSEALRDAALFLRFNSYSPFADKSKRAFYKIIIEAHTIGGDTAAFMARWHEVNEVVFAIVLRMGGSISAEHGIGVLKRDELPDVKDKVAIELMRSIKAMLDPLGIMNPGKVL